MTTSLGPEREFEDPRIAGRAEDGRWAQSWIVNGTCLVLALAAIIGIYWSTVEATIGVWAESETFNHCFLVVPICAYLIWRRWDLLSQQVPAPWPFGLLPLLGGALLWLLGDMAGVLLVEQVALVAMIQATVLTLLGWRVVRLALFPLFYFWFTVPVGTGLIPFFQYLTADMVVPLLRLTGIPVFLEGLYLYIPSGSFEVAEACSGVRYLISSVALGFLASNLFFESTWRRILFVVLSFAVPILANGVRAYGIVMIAHLSDYEYAVGADHLIYGWVFFSVVTLCLLSIGAAMREPLADVAPRPSAVVRGPQPVARPGMTTLVLVATIAVAWSTALYQSYLASKLTDRSGGKAEFALAVPKPWKATAGGEDAPAVEPSFPGATSETLQRFIGPKGTLELYVAYYFSQQQGAEVVNEANRPLGGQIPWRIVGTSLRDLRIGGEVIAVNELVLEARSERRLLWSWFWVDGTFTANRYMAKLLEVRSKLLSGRGEAAFISLSTPVEGKLEQAAERMVTFLQDATALDAALAELGTDRSD